MIWSGHKIEEKVIIISKLNKKNRELRAEYIDTKTELAKMKLESYVRNKVEINGLFPLNIPPNKIKLITHN